jgi:hypothetical protein
MENNNQNLTPQSVPQPPAQKKWYKNKGVIWIIGLAIIAAISIWLYYAKQPTQNISPIIINHKSNGTPTATTSPPATAITTEPVVSSGPTSTAMTDWKIYTNSVYGIQVKYPSYLILQNESVDGVYLTLANVATTTYWQGITIHLFNNPDSLNPSDWWSKNQTAQTCYSDPEQGQISGFNSIEIDSDSKCIEFLYIFVLQKSGCGI